MVKRRTSKKKKIGNGKRDPDRTRETILLAAQEEFAAKGEKIKYLRFRFKS